MIDKISEPPSYFDDFHILTGKPTSLQELSTHVIDAVGSNSTVKYTSGRIYDVEKFYGDYSKAKKLLGYEPKIDIKKGVEMSVKTLLQ